MLCIILAHVEPPAVLFQIRNFDVPLMVLVAGSAFSATAESRNRIGYLDYVARRFIRLVIPTWIFLAIFFTATLIIFMGLNKEYPFPTEKVISSFSLMEGIGYVWVIRVFLLVALIAPLTELANKSSSMSRFTYLSAIFAYVIYEIMVWYLPRPSLTFFAVLLEDILYLLIPYGCIFFIGTRICFEDRRKLFYFATASFILFCVFSITVNNMAGSLVQTQRFKYPPTGYYISYAIFVASSLYLLVGSNFSVFCPFRNYIAFLGRSSMWIYLWHIFLIYIFNWSKYNINFVTKFFVILIICIITVLLQRILLERLVRNIGNNKSRLLKMIFS